MYKAQPGYLDTRPWPGYMHWEPQYFNHKEFLKLGSNPLIGIAQGDPYYTEILKMQGEPYGNTRILTQAQRLLPKYIAQYEEPPDFPDYFMRYYPRIDGYRSIRQKNESTPLF